MKRAEAARSHLLLLAAFFIPVVWLALLVAPALSGGLPALLLYLGEAMDRPFDIRWVADTPEAYWFLQWLTG